jgi:hypothetical protein
VVKGPSLPHQRGRRSLGEFRSFWWNSVKLKGDEMEKIIMLDKKTFLSMAKLLKLDEEDFHLEELYTYVEKLFPSFKVAEGIDLAEIEPMLTLVFQKE